ncbi:MAG TPA: hypothetical protein DD622_02460 [Opitutae bacterium]|nr:hypothetical protein [Opitutae bacterium]|tara:strand:- start:1081 stop:1320 length:240 start_codon:yes stop_codon:yes gene_type:complete
MSKRIIFTLTALFCISILGCCKKSNPSEPRTLDNAPERLGAGFEGAAQGPINAVKTTGKAIGDGAAAVRDAFSGDNKTE